MLRAVPLAQHSLGLQQLGVGHALEPVRKQLEGTALGQQHEQAVQSLDQVWVVLHIQQLQAQVCGREEVRGQGSEVRDPGATLKLKYMQPRSPARPGWEQATLGPVDSAWWG